MLFVLGGNPETFSYILAP